jgi:hypothetical protein
MDKRLIFIFSCEGGNMKRQSNIPQTDRPSPVDEDKEKPNLDPIRDDPEPLTLPPRETPRKKKAQIGEGSYEGTEQYAEGISKYLETADVEADAKAAAPGNADEAEEMRQAEADAASQHRDASGRSADEKHSARSAKKK